MGTRPQAVVELLKTRLAEGRGVRYDPEGPGKRSAGALGTEVERSSRALERPMPRKLALIVEGGGMRGVLSAGSLLALDQLGFRDCFDQVFATSAGAVNATYLLSGQGALGITVYFDDINNRRFYNPRRITKVVDVDYVYDYVVPTVKTLNETALRHNPTDLFFSVTDAETGCNVLLDVKRQPEPVSRLLKATSALPVLYNRTVAVGGRHYVDGGLTCSIPIREAVANGCTDILIVLTQMRGYTIPPPTAWGRLIFYMLLGHSYPALQEAYGRHPAKANEWRRKAVGDAPMLAGVNIATLCPTAAELIVGRTTMDRNRLIDGARLMAERTFRAFAEDPQPMTELFERYRGGG
jgi:predicted patatin/cPLA2 family phospholipase